MVSRRFGFKFAHLVQGPGADAILVEQPEVGLDAHRHPGIHRGLAFQQQVDVEPIGAPTQAPDEDRSGGAPNPTDAIGASVDAPP
jgi:hypothetical protein